ncbi:MAG: hypothetical protein COA89_16790, partial [Acidithiobacillus sp.]
QKILERWTVNPYVASSSLARGASFLDVFQQSFHVQFSNVANFWQVCHCFMQSIIRTTDAHETIIVAKYLNHYRK